MATDPSLTPWVLVRRDKPLTRFADLTSAQKFFDQLRHNGPRQPDAAVFGPGGEAWYCRGTRDGYWIRDDARRMREAPADETEEERAG